MEDDPGLARLVQITLERAGCIVDVARDGEEGLAMYAAGSYDVVAVDQNMPVHNGLEVIRILASQGPLPPVVMITGGGSEEIAVEAMKLGARDYIVKDMDGRYIELLPTVIEQVLQQQRLAEEKQRAEEELRIRDSAIASSINAIALADLEGTLRYVNHSFLKLWGYDDDKEILGRSAVEFWQVEEEAAVVIETLRDKGSWIGQLVARRRDGTLFDVQLSASMVTDEAGKPISMMASFVDITERKQAEEALKRRLEQLISLNKASQAVTASLELNQVLAEIVSLASEVVASDYAGVVLINYNARTELYQITSQTSGLGFSVFIGD